jgi:DNA-directed RNA polymerase specialized sigma24 family protein
VRKRVVRSQRKLKLLYELGWIESPEIKEVEVPLINFEEEKLSVLSSPTFEMILKLRFKEGKSYEEIGRTIGRTRERARQLERRALAYLRHTQRRTQVKAIN